MSTGFLPLPNLRAGSPIPQGRGPSALPLRAVVLALCAFLAAMFGLTVAALAQPNQAPEFPSTESGARSVTENTGPGVDIGLPVGAQDADNDPLTYTISGADAGAFAVVPDTGQLQTKSALNYEAKSTYRFTITATDPSEAADSIGVTLSITNVDEPGNVHFVRTGPDVEAHLRDPDGGVRGKAWRWARSADGATNWTEITGAGKDFYTPVTADQGKYLRATVTYTDALGPSRQAQAVYNNLLAAPPIRVATMVSGLAIPWDMAFTPDGTMLFTQRSGILGIRLANGTVRTITADFDDLFVQRETGLMSIAVDPQFASNRRFYTCQGHTGPEVQVIAWTMDSGYTEARRVADPLVGGIPASSRGRHTGCRLRFGLEGYLWISTGDGRSAYAPQDLSSLGGKVLRVDPLTGSGAPSNPFPSSPVYTYGHRNVQGLTVHPDTDEMWAVEHGPAFDDEINLLLASGNYGWDPTPGYDELLPMTNLARFPDAIEAKWSSGSLTLAPSGGVFLEGDHWGIWEGRLAVATLKDQRLHLFEFTPEGDLVSRISVPQLEKTFGRLRTPILGPDGALYISTSNGQRRDRILRVAETQPPAAPSINSISSGDRTLVVYWSVPTDNGGEDITGYDLRYIRSATADKSDDHWTMLAGVRTGSGPFEYPLRGVDNGFRYHVQVRAVNRVGVGRWSGTTVGIPSANDPPAFSIRTLDLTVAEDAPVGRVLTQVAARDPERDRLTYTLEGQSDYFEIDSDTGQLRIKTALDYETSPEHSLTVQVSDGRNVNGEVDPSADDTMTVTVTVIDINEPPELDGERTVTIPEGSGRSIGTYVARDQEQDTLVWTLAGSDSSDFEITEDGVLSFGAEPDYEDPQDSGRNNRYHLRVVVSDGENSPAIDLTVTVENVDEMGGISLPSRQPQVGTSLSTTLTDPDGDVANPSWQWRTSTDRVNWSDLPGSNQPDYTPGSSDEGNYLQVTVSYADGEGDGKSVTKEFDFAVRPAPANNNRPRFSTNRMARSIEENAPVQISIGQPITASDTDGDPLTYTLDRTGRAVFDIDEATGQLTTRAALDHERKSAYTVTVTVTDPSLEHDTTSVTITIEDVDEPPTLTGPGVVLVPKKTRRPVATYLARDPERATLTWTLDSPYPSTFRLTNGVLAFTNPPEYQPSKPDNIYQITLDVTDGTHTTYLPVTIAVIDRTDTNQPPPPPPPPPPIRTVTGGNGGGGGGGGGGPAPTTEAFTDVPQTSTHAPNIAALARAGVFEDTLCARGRFCPDQPIKRWTMAVWLVRIIEGADPRLPTTRFTDIPTDAWWAPHTERLAVLGITLGCDTEPARYCPNDPVTRAQMAAFLNRAFRLAPAPPAGFTDTEGHSLAAHIDALYTSDVTKGCTAQPLRFCPDQPTTRAQMATFLNRVRTR